MRKGKKRSPVIKEVVMRREKMFKKRYVTLVEVMIVMFLIALIAGVVAYNYRGSLDEGRAFETKQNIEKVSNILELELAKSGVSDYNALVSGDGWKELVKQSPLVKDKVSIFKDGWGGDLKIRLSDDKGSIIIYSENQYCKDHPEKCSSRGAGG